MSPRHRQRAVKPGQDQALDLPTIGPETVTLAVNSGYRGIAVMSGATLIAEPARVTEQADAAGVFVCGVRLP